MASRDLFAADETTCVLFYYIIIIVLSVCLCIHGQWWTVDAPLVKQVGPREILFSLFALITGRLRHVKTGDIQCPGTIRQMEWLSFRLLFFNVFFFFYNKYLDPALQQDYD
jgi:hypothetical protein